MDNFVFSDNLEVSIVEHRLISLFEMLDELQISYFFPSILFNESFWQAPKEKRLLIIQNNQREWFGESPREFSYFYKDTFLLDLIKSLKVTYFSYTKVSLESLVGIFKAKNKFSITGYESFSSEQNNILEKINEIVERTTEEEKVNKLQQKPTIAKISAVKFYSKFLKKKEIQGLVLVDKYNLGFWESFFNSLKLIDEKQETKVLEKVNFYFTHKEERILDELEEDIKEYKTLKSLYENKQINFQVLDIVDFESKFKFDYIYIDSVLSKSPTHILTKYNNDYFEALARLVYVDRADEKKAVERTAELQAPVKDLQKLDRDILENIDYEILYQEFKNANVINLIEDNYEVIERSYTRFSVPILTFLVKAIKSLEKDGYIEIWDNNEVRNSRYNLGLIYDEDKSLHTLVNFDLYTQIIKSFSDIKTEHKIKSINQVLSEEVFDGKDIFITLKDLVQFLIINREVTQKIFEIDNFVEKHELLRVEKSVNKYEALKKKNLMFVGVPTLMYSKGFKNFKKGILANEKLKRYVKEDLLINNNFTSYKNEFIFAQVANFYGKAAENLDILISQDINSSHNKEFYKFLSEIGLEKEGVINIIKNEWERLKSYTDLEVNPQILEITNLN